MYSEEHIDNNESIENQEIGSCFLENNKEEIYGGNSQPQQHSNTNIIKNNKETVSKNNKNRRVSLSNDDVSSHVESIVGALDDLCLNKDIPIERTRRCSLPETSINDIQCIESNLKTIVNNNSSNNLPNDVQSKPNVSLSITSDGAKVAPNITEVVKNVHGLFSSLKNVYKDNKGNLGDMIHATQKNFASAKNGYFNMKQEIFYENKPTTTQKEILETLNKYTNLNLTSEEHQIDNFNMESNHLRKGKETHGPDGDGEELVQSRESPYMKEETSDALLFTNISEIANKEQCKQIEELKSVITQRDKVNKDLEAKCLEISKQLETSVMRYAMSERQILSMDKIRNAAVEKETKAKEECAILERRLKTANLEKTRICNILDEKSHDLLATQKEVTKLKEDLSSADTKLKWAQNKLHSEIEAHKETSLLAEKLGQQVAQYEINSCNSGTSHSTPQHSHSHNTLTDVQLKEMEAVTILERHERQRFEEKCKTLQKELEQMKTSYKNCTLLVEELRAQAESSAGEAAALRDICNELRIQAAKDCERLAATQARAARLDTVFGQLQQEQEKCLKLMEDLESERKIRSAAQAESELRTRREAELLRQAERLTEAGVRLQATCSEAEAKALALSVDNASLRAAAEREAQRVAKARGEADAEKKGREVDARALAAAAARHQRSERLAVQKAEQLEGDLRVMATKHASTVKELKREIQQWKRKCKNMECGPHSNDKTTQRTGSCSSLSSYDGSTSQPLNEDTAVDRQQLVEKIVELQRLGARRSERLEFLEGHSTQLTAELQKKSKLLRGLMASMPAGALAAPASDRAKVEIGKHGGIMASLFTHEVTDSSMSLELALEITAKLQVVLEDTLLKNITLKENMDTLGDEISLLKEELKKRPRK